MQKSLFTLFVLCLLWVSIPAWSEPSVPQAKQYFSRAKEAYQVNDPKLAQYWFQRAAQADPTYTEAHYNLGAIYFNQGNYTQALASFNNALKADPGDIPSRYETARVFEKLNRIPEAIAAYDMIPETDKRYPFAQSHIQRLESPIP